MLVCIPFSNLVRSHSLLTQFSIKHCHRRSKSTNDIQIDPAAVREIRYEELQKFREKIKHTEDKWQDVSITDLAMCLCLLHESRQAD